MHTGERIARVSGGVLIAALFLASIYGFAQKKTELFEATAYGQSTQMGRTFNVKIYIESYSPPEDQKILLDAFAKGGNEAIVDALEKMPTRGRISIPASVGYEVTYIRQWATPTGRRIRLVTSRPIAFGESRRATRSKDYSVSAVELEVSNEKGKTTGTLLPACQLKLNKQKEIEVEAFQNPWRLGNFLDWDR